MGTGIIGLIIGLLLGIGIAYWVLQKRLEQQEKEFQSRLQQRQEELEQDRERRTRVAVQTVQEDLQRQLREKEAELNRVVATREQDKERPSSLPRETQAKDEEIIVPSNRINTELQNSSELSEEAIDRDSSPNIVTPSNHLETELQSDPQLPKEGFDRDSLPSPIPLPNRPETELQSDPQLPKKEVDRENLVNIPTSAGFADAELEKSLQPPKEGAYKNESLDIVSPPSNQSAEPQQSSQLPEAVGDRQKFLAKEVVDINKKKTAPFKSVELNLKQKIVAWGDSRLLIYISQLVQYVRYPAVEIRECVAAALGKICEGKMLRTEVEKAILALGMLAKDSEVSVRKQAIESLGKIKSEKIIPFLTEGLRDADRDVVKLASSTLQNFKSYPIKKKTKVWVKRELETDKN